MTRTAQRGAPPRAPAPPPPSDPTAAEILRPLPSAAGQAFEQHLLAKYGERDLQVRRVPMPPAVKQVSYVWIREQDSNDEVQAAAWADALMKPDERRRARVVHMIEQREAKRLSICAIWRRNAPAPEEVNAAAPLMEIDRWSTKFWGVLELHYTDLNGIPAEDLQNSLEGAVILGAPLPVNPNSARSERQEGEPSDAR